MRARSLLLILLAMTFVAFAPVRDNGFVNWDDPQNLVHNEHFRGLSGQNLHWMFTDAHGGHYHPLTWMSFALDHYLWDARPAGIHLTSLLLHAATALLLLLLAQRLLAAGSGEEPGRATTIGAFAAAMLFAVHPLRVESVAWATERRDVLCGFFLVLTVWLYLRGASAGAPRSGRAQLVASWLCYVLSLLSKASGIVLPVVLILIDVFPLRRWQAGTRETRRSLIVEKLAFVIPAVAAGALAAWAQAGAGAMWSLKEHPLGLRIGQAFYGIVFYVFKTIWPSNLAALYEQRPDAAALDWQNVVCGAVVVAAAAVLWSVRKRLPAAVVAGCAYVVLVAPTLGLVQSGPQVVADRYSYFSCMPLAILAGAGIATAWRRLGTNGRNGILVGIAVCSLTFVMLTRSQVRLWKDSETLWTSVIERGGSRGIAHANLASVLNERGEFESACAHARQALDTLPGNRTAHFALGSCSAALDDLATAEEHFATALDIAEAVGKTASSEIVALADVKARLGEFEEAEGLYRRLIAAEPGNAVWPTLFSDFYADQQRWAEAVGFLRQAIKVDPLYAPARSRLAGGLVHMGDLAGAVEVLEAGVRLGGDAALTSRLAWILATASDDSLRDGPRALRLALDAVDATGGRSITALEALAAAYAETGDFINAVWTIQYLLEEDTFPLPPHTNARLEDQLAQYRLNEPHRE